MKNFLFLLFLFPVLAFSQEGMDESNCVFPENDTIQVKEFDKWSIELNVGMNRTDGYYSPGYYQVDAENDLAFGGIAHFDLGVRYMFNEKFGLKFSGAYDIIETYSDRSLPFDNNLLRFNLEGVLNLRNYLNFDSFTKRFGLLAHGGVHYSFFGDGDGGSASNALDPGSDEVAGFIIGFTPQYKLSKTFVLTMDASFIKNYRQHQTWDYTRADPNESNLNAQFMNFSLGISAYIGKHKEHADWYVEDETIAYEDQLKRLKEYIDCRTPKHEHKVDWDPAWNPIVFNIVNNEIEKFDVIERLIRDEYFRIYFDFDIDMPNDQSHDDVSTLINFMKKNPDQRIEVIGLTDVLGSDNYNGGLSDRRANNVKQILMAAGIDESRIVAKGGGENPVYTSKNEEIRRLARTAIVKLID